MAKRKAAGGAAPVPDADSATLAFIDVRRLVSDWAKATDQFRHGDCTARDRMSDFRSRLSFVFDDAINDGIDANWLTEIGDVLHQFFDRQEDAHKSGLSVFDPWDQLPSRLELWLLKYQPTDMTPSGTKSQGEAAEPIDAAGVEHVKADDATQPLSLPAIDVAMDLFLAACDELELDPGVRANSRPAFEWLIQNAEWPEGATEPSWFRDRNFETFSSYLTKVRTRDGCQIYDRRSGVETRSVRHPTSLDRQVDDE